MFSKPNAEVKNTIPTVKVTEVTLQLFYNIWSVICKHVYVRLRKTVISRCLA